MKTYNAGLIGFGYWGKILHKYLTKHKGFSLKAIATRHPESIAGIIPPGIKACTIEELAGDPEIDAVFIATPIITHYEITRLCLEQGKHVFCEKPLTSVYFEAQHLKEISGKTGRHLFTDYIYTFSPSLIKMIHIAESGEIGKLQSIAFNIRQLGHFSENNVYIDLGCHCLGLLDMMIPLDSIESEISETSGGHWNFEKRDLFIRNGIVETGEILFTHKTQTGESFQGSIFLSFNHPHKTRNITIYGETGTISYDINRENPLQLEKYAVERAISRDAIDRQHIEFNFDETSNISFVVDSFRRVLTGEIPSNIDRAVRVTEILDKIGVNIK